MLTARRTAAGAVLLGGHVTSADGSVLRGARVCATCATASCDAALRDSRPVCVESDADGRYRLTALPAEEYVIGVGAEGHASTLARNGATFSVGKAGLVDTDIDVVLQPGGALLSGIVVDAAGGPVSGATVQANGVHSSGGILPQVTVSDEAGAFALSLSSGPVLVRAFAEGYAPAQITRYAPDASVRLVVTPPSRVAGHVVTSTDGQPVAGAEVRALGSMGQESAVVSDELGNFAIEGMSPGDYVLDASANGWRSPQRVSVAVGFLDSVSDVVVPVDAAYAVEGVVMLGDAPCELGEIRIGSQSGAGPMYQAFIKRGGAVRVEAVPPGTYDSMSSCADLGIAQGPRIEVTNRDVKGVVWRLEPGVDITVRAESARGKPVPRVSVSVAPVTEDPMRQVAEQRSGRTGEDGKILLRRLKPGSYQLQASGLRTPMPLEVTAETANAEIPIVLEANGFIEVHVRARDGKPNDDVAVSAIPFEPGRPDFAFGAPRGDGLYVIGPLAVGEYRVEVRDGINPRKAAAADAPTLVTADDTIKLELAFGGYDGLISGRVVSSDGRPVRDVWVSAATSDMSQDTVGMMMRGTLQADSRRVLTDAQGTFQLADLDAAASFTVAATRPKGGSASIENVKPGQNIEIELPEPEADTKL